MAFANRVIEAKKFERHITAILKRGGASKGDILEVFRMSRRLLEIETQSSRYPVLKLYCNWLLHTELTQKSSFFVLERVTAIICDLRKKYDKDMGGLIMAISEAFGIHQLRAELLRFHSNIDGIDRIFSSYSTWNEVVKMILEALVGNPIRIPNDALEQRNSIGKFARKMKEQYGRRYIARAVNIVDDVQNTEDEGGPTLFGWQVVFLDPPSWKTSEENYVALRGVLWNLESRSDFLYD